MATSEQIREHLDRQEQIGWHLDWPEALHALRAVLDLCDEWARAGKGGVPIGAVEQRIARALGVRGGER